MTEHPDTVDQEKPSVRHYLLLPTILVGMILAIPFGGPFLWFAVVAYLILGFVVDAIAGEDGRPMDGRLSVLICAIALYGCIPLTIICTLLFANALAPSDPLGAAALATSLTGPDWVTPQAEAEVWHLIGAVLSMGAIFSAASGIVGHELMHKVDRPLDLFLSRVVLAFCLDTPLAIEHVHGHHRTVGTPADPTTARRGIGFWRFLPTSVGGGTSNAFRFEADRLRRQGLSPWSWRNRVLSGMAGSMLLPAGFLAIAGWPGLIAFLAAAINGKIYIEAVNYISHYGLVRVPGTPIAARHSWNSYRKMTNGLLFNLPRHSSHHLKPTAPYWRLGRQEDAPQSPFGMHLTVMAALIPPLWHRIMASRLADWDQRLATPQELRILAESGGRLPHESSIADGVAAS